MTAASLAVHAVEWSSVANGPGVRAVVWTQGCTLACRGCFNPRTHSVSVPEHSVDALADELIQRAQDGVTITGGEPFQQWEAVAELLTAIRHRRPALSVLVFTGYSVAELHRAHADASDVLQLVDVLVAGRYVDRRRQEVVPLLGSGNQTIHVLSDRHSTDELAAVPLAEVLVRPDGTVTVTGVAPPRLLESLTVSNDVRTDPWHFTTT